MSARDPIWLRENGSRPGRRPSHSLEELAIACVRIADDSGLGELSMRRVAEALGTGPASLYRYVTGKDDLVDLMVDAVHGEFEYASMVGDVHTDVMALAEQARALHRRHPWLSSIRRPVLGPNAVRHLDRLVAALAPAGLDTMTIMTGAALISGWVTNFASQELSAGSAEELTGGGVEHLATMMTRGDHPHLAAALDRSTGTPAADADAMFRAGIDTLLFGILPGRADLS